MRGLLLVCASLFLPVTSIWAQTGNQEKFKVTGSVVNAAGGEPVRGAMVEFQGSTPRTVMTGSDGRFEIDDMAAGSFYVIARRPGFTSPNRQQRVTVGSATDSITVKLVPLAKISGRITDREGEPIDGVQIRCMHEFLSNGRKQWQQSNGASTDETGHFLIEDLTPGAYILQTGTSRLYRMPQPKSEAARYVYPPTFYPDAVSRDMAQQIQLSAGEEAKVDMELHSIRAIRVSVTTVPRQPNVMGYLDSDEDYMFNSPASSDAEGVLTFGAVPPGSWKIVVRGGGKANEAVYGEVQVDVGTNDIDNLTIPLSTLVDIPVVVSGGANPQVFVQLFSKTGAVHGAGPDPNGGIILRGVPPGTYRLVARSNGNGCISSVMSGSQDLLRDQLTVSSGSAPPIQIVKSDNCSQLTITPNTKENVTIVVTSRSQGFEPRQLMASNGTATADGLSPGEYQIYAFDDASDLEYANPEALREFKSQTVTLETGEKKSVQLEVNERRSR